MVTIKLLQKLSLEPGISGHEHGIARIMKDELSAASDFTQDNMGSCVFELKGKSSKPRIMFVAHMDEIGFIVSDILPNGFIKMQPIGGWNPFTLLSSTVEIINSEGKRFPGVIGAVPIHFLKNREDSKPEIENMFIDIGAVSREEVESEYNIQLGDAIVPQTSFQHLKKNNQVICKAFDDRAGIAAVIELGKIAASIPHPNTILCVGSVQEEVGTRGAQTLANYIQADICIILEGAPADDVPGIGFQPQTCLGKGAHLRIFDPTMIVNPNLKKFIVKLAEKEDIKIQPTVRRSGGTDGRQLHIAGRGIPSIVLGVPVRYAHSHNSMVNLHDFRELMKLLESIIRNTDEKVLSEILKN